MTTVITARNLASCARCPKPVRPGDRIPGMGERCSATSVHAQCHPHIA